MDNTFYSVDQVSTMLGLHPKTMRRYIREGKLRANKVGKQYRIAGHDLSVFVEGREIDMSGIAKETVAPAPPINKIAVSAVVDIVVADEYESDRITSMVLAAANCKDPSHGKCSVNVQQIENNKKLRIMLWGDGLFVETMLSSINVYSDHNKQEEHCNELSI